MYNFIFSIYDYCMLVISQACFYYIIKFSGSYARHIAITFLSYY